MEGWKGAIRTLRLLLDIVGHGYVEGFALSLSLERFFFFFPVFGEYRPEQPSDESSARVCS